MIKDHNHDMKLSLFENGVDFIKNSLDDILDIVQEFRLKYAIIHLAAGVELVLKQALYQEHWTLLFQDVNLAKSDFINSGKFKSVDFETILKRLENVCEVEFSESDKTTLRNLREDRNQIEHIHFKVNSLATKARCSEVLNFIIDFIDLNIIGNSISSKAQEDLDVLHLKKLEFKEFVKHRMNTLKADLANSKPQICPVCKQKALILEDASGFKHLVVGYGPKCLFCNYHDSPEKVAKLYVEEVLGISAHLCITDGGEFPLYNCFYCNEGETLINKGDEFICFACTYTIPSEVLGCCSYCGEHYERPAEDAHNMCEECISNAFERD